MSPTIHVDGSATAYRLYDIGYGIELERVADALGADMRGRSRPGRIEAQTFQIRNPPVFAALGERVVMIGGRPCSAAVSAHLFDFGVCSMRLTFTAPANASWEEFVEFGSAVDSAAEVGKAFEAELAALIDRIRPVVQRLVVAAEVEEYVVFRVSRITSPDGSEHSHEQLTDDDLIPLLLRERRRLAPAARRELLAHRFSFYADDLAILTWDNAFIVEPRPDDVDVEFVLEFANAQLLELRLYDAQLDAELPALYERIATRRRRRPAISRRFRALLADMQTRVTEITEVVERVDNAFKITDDVYLARVYAAALDLFRERAWRRGIDRKLQIFRDTYTMLNAETQVARGELMEVIVVLLIAAELIIGLTH